MADRKATNKYYPPEWDPSKGSINKFRNSHPLRERARMLDKGILIIRFEMPYNIWCTGCDQHIGMGVRYNAQKSKIGMYHTTPVMQFRMKCHLCDNYIVMKTDPANLDYEIVSGARRQERRWDQAENGQIEVDKSLKQKLMLDPMFKLEHELVDKSKTQQSKSSITELTANREELWGDDYSTNCDLRDRFRAQKKDLKKIAVHDSKLLAKSSLPLSLPLLAESDKDMKVAKVLQLKAHSRQEEVRQQQQKRKILNSSIFGSSSKFNHTLISNSHKKIRANGPGSSNTLIKPKSVIANSSNIGLINYDSSSDDSDT